MYAKCKRCKRSWNVSVKKIFSKEGYLCPHCDRGVNHGSRRKRKI